MKSADTDNDSVADVFYEFDALGRRVARDDGTQDTIFVQVGQQTIADYVSGTAAASPEYIYAWGSYIDELILRTKPSGTDLHYHRNQQYSTYAVTNSSGSIQERYAYSPYGEMTITDASGTTQSASNNDTRYAYTGRELNTDLNLYRFSQGMYAIRLGRTLTRDIDSTVSGFYMKPKDDGGTWFRRWSQCVLVAGDLETNFYPDCFLQCTYACQSYIQYGNRIEKNPIWIGIPIRVGSPFLLDDTIDIDSEYCGSCREIMDPSPSVVRDSCPKNVFQNGKSAVSQPPRHQVNHCDV
jgi:hypothetical protein